MLKLHPLHGAAPVLVASLVLVPLLAGGTAHAAENVIDTAYTTGYTWYDNTPAGSAEIARPILHDLAGGKGTYSDPITLAVGIDENGEWDYPAGTRFYIPGLRRYFIAEDQCGHDASEPCHNLTKAPGDTTVWLDLWLGGGNTTKATIDSCMAAVTDLRRVVVNPDSDYVVASGSGIFHDGECDYGYGDTLVKKDVGGSTPTPTRTTTSAPQPTSTVTLSPEPTSTREPVVASPLSAAMLGKVVGGNRFDDGTAPSGQHVSVLTNGSYNGTLSGEGFLTVWAYGDQCSGAPQMRIEVDGKVSTVSVPNEDRFSAYTTKFEVGSGQHSVRVIFDNDYATRSCDRNLHLGGVAFAE